MVVSLDLKYSSACSVRQFYTTVVYIRTVGQYTAYIRTVVHVLYHLDVKTPSLIVAWRRARRCNSVCGVIEI